MSNNNEYIAEYFDTGFLSPRINFVLFCLSALIGIAGLLWV